MVRVAELPKKTAAGADFFSRLPMAASCMILPCLAGVVEWQTQRT